MVFTYLDAFSRQDQFAEYLSDYSCLDEMKEHYRKGGLGDVKCKKFLIKVMEEMLTPIRAERAKWEADIPAVYDILRTGTAHAVEETNQTLAEVRDAMRINYFDDRSIITDWENWIHK
jgi:tryptophanyl-tRNA synthetase